MICTGNVRSSAGFPATPGSASPTVRAYYASCGRIPARSCCSWARNSASSRNGTSTGARLASAGDKLHAGLRLLRARSQPAVSRAMPALHARDCEPEGFRWLVVGRRGAVGVRLAAPGRPGGSSGRGHLQFHPGAAPRLSHRPALRRTLAGGLEHRCDGSMAGPALAIRARSRPSHRPVAWPAGVGDLAAAAARRIVSATRAGVVATRTAGSTVRAGWFATRAGVTTAPHRPIVCLTSDHGADDVPDPDRRQAPWHAMPWPMFSPAAAAAG